MQAVCLSNKWEFNNERKIKMKKLGIFLLIACMAIGFAGCKDKEDDGTSSKAESTVVSDVADTSSEESISSSEAESTGTVSIDYDPTASMDTVSETSSTESIEEIIEVLD